jgi:peptidoglycan/LPS O-acetylase OafA/YrhL
MTGMSSVHPQAAAPTILIRLDYLDGLRGLAALYVVLNHASPATWAGGPLPHVILTGIKLLAFGHFAVAVFIILSGYCLMLPVARSADNRLRGGSGEYLRRRAWRILPPYYAALLVTLLLLKLAPQLNVRSGTVWDGVLPAFRTDVLLSHLFLVHNLLDQWKFKINFPLWSVATEWQIYFFFPFLLLPLWRRFGLAVTVITAVILGLLPHFLLPSPWNLEGAVPWYLGLFAIGMGAASVNFAQDKQSAWLKTHIPWGKLMAVQLVLVLVFALFQARWWWMHLWIADIQIGLCTASLLIHCTQECQNHRPNGLLCLFQARPVVLLGTMSYSLYLMHLPVLALLHIPLAHLNVSPAARIGTMIFVFVPLSIVLTYLFHLVFERRFMSSHK